MAAFSPLWIFMYAPLLAASLRNYITTDLTLRHVTLRYDESLARFLFIIEFKLLAESSRKTISGSNLARTLYPTNSLNSYRFDFYRHTLARDWVFLFFKFTTRTRKRLKLINICFVFFCWCFFVCWHLQGLPIPLEPGRSDIAGGIELACCCWGGQPLPGQRPIRGGLPQLHSRPARSR